jgi:DNA topoisomerase I
LPRPVATHPESGEPILVGIGRYGPYVQHGKTFANLEKDDDVLAIGANRAIDLVVAKESGAVYRRGGQRDPGRPLGEDSASGKTVVVKAGRFGPYVTDGEVNATLPRAMSADAVTLDEAIGLLNARRAAGPSKKPRRSGRATASKTSARGAGAAKGAAKKAAAKKTAAKKGAGKNAAKKAAASKTA